MAGRSRLILTGVALLTTLGVLSACSSGGTAATGTPAAATAPTLMSAAPAGSSAAPVTESNPAGDIPDTQAFVDYTPTPGGYTVQVPEGWARTDTATGTGTGTGTGTLFSDKYNSIRIETAAAAVAPTVQSGQAELAAIRAAAQGFTPGDVTTVQRQAGSAVLITYRPTPRRTR